MIEVEVFGVGLAAAAPSEQEIHSLCERVAVRLGVEQAHVAVEFVDARRIAELNADHRNRQGPTDVLSFPIDGAEGSAASCTRRSPRSAASPDASA